LDERTSCTLAPSPGVIEQNNEFKIDGGSVANLHKGFQFHFQQARQPDGVWIAKLIDGSGDVCAELLFHQRLRFKLAVDECRLFSVDATSGTVQPTK
jgi:hypothetical protein